ncbi:TetR/AcrR family transcriptional regulator [Nocardiopsis ganjiahuensis]|uniref:TetR/AcrR family transcriptional regulator n=1 Tax=Nocardiopsis ganjiahuensis TaxID=239984 RepID=UPI0003475286|nr:TetR/AcrR family transcriptional regulator [Nocardiopsis ganjiahuensis]
MNNDAVPDFFRRLWRLPTAPARLGRRSTLDVETVVASAVRLADEGGLEAATLPKVAKELDVTPMSLYRYVGSKQELLQLMLDAASPPRTPAAEPSGWREGMRLWASDLWELYTDRPWIPRVPIYRSPSGPNQIAWLERGFAQLADTGLDWGDKLMVLTLLTGFVRHSALLAQDLEEGRSDHSETEDKDGYARALRALVTPEHYPHTAEMLASAALLPSDEPAGAAVRADFDAGLELVLDGLAHQLPEDA